MVKIIAELYICERSWKWDTSHSKGLCVTHFGLDYLREIRSLVTVLEQTKCRRVSVYHFRGLSFLRKAQKGLAVSGENSRKKELNEVMRT